MCRNTFLATTLVNDTWHYDCTGAAHQARPQALPNKETDQTDLTSLMTALPQPATSLLAEAQQKADSRMAKALAAAPGPKGSLNLGPVSFSLAAAIVHLEHAAKAPAAAGDNADK